MLWVSTVWLLSVIGCRCWASPERRTTGLIGSSCNVRKMCWNILPSIAVKMGSTTKCWTTWDITSLHRVCSLNCTGVGWSSITDNDVFVALCQLPGYTFSTVSRKATNLVNRVAVQHLFTTVLLAQIQYDCDLPPISIYRGMQVIITQNRYKDHGVVNGARAKFY